MTSLKPSFVLVLAALVAGCASVGPDHETPKPQTPPDWSAWHGGSPELLDPALRAATGEASARWWEGFQDPALDSLQARALASNADLRTAALRFAQSRMQRLTVAAQRGVQVGAGAGVTRQRQSEVGASTRLIDAIAADPARRDELIDVLSQPFNLYQAGFDASWEFDLWGRVRRSIEAADANVAAAQAALREVQLGVQAELARSYFELRGVQRQLRLARSDVAAAGESLSLVKNRADGGLVTDLDVTRQSALLAELQARLPSLLEQEAQAANQISLLLGVPPGALQAELAPRDEAPDASARLPDLALGLPSQAALARPDIQRAEAQLHAATAGIGIAVADLYPRITIGASFGFESFKADRFGEWGSRQWTVGPSLTLPIFDHGRRQSTLTLRRLEQQEAAVAYQQTVLKAWHEIDGALSGYTAERRRNEQLAERERSSRAAYELAKVRYAHGLTDFLVELDAQRSLLQAQREHAESTSRLAVRLVAVYKALGRTEPLDGAQSAQAPGSNALPAAQARAD